MVTRIEPFYRPIYYRHNLRLNEYGVLEKFPLGVREQYNYGARRNGTGGGGGKIPKSLFRADLQQL